MSLPLNRLFSWTGSHRTWLALAIAGGFALRASYLNHGIPYGVGVDEPVIIGRVVYMMRSGDYNPHFFDYPGLYIYSQLFVGIARFLWGAMAGEWRSLAAAPPEAFYLWGRSLTVLIGTATIVLVYRIGRRWSEWHGVLAAGLLAVLPSAVCESHFVLTDTPLTFFTTLTLLLSLRALEVPGLMRLAMAGAAAGLAAATKYPGAVSVVMPLAVAGLASGRATDRPLRMPAVVGACVAAFALAAPYTFLDLPGFLNAFAYMSADFARANPTAWLTYLIHLRLSLGWPASVLALGGFVLATARCVGGPNRLRWFVLACFPVVYYLVMVTQGGILYGRYALPMVPAACLLVACAAVPLCSTARFFPTATRDWAVSVALALLILLPPASRSIEWLATMAKGTTAQLVVQWLERNVPAGTRVVYEGGGEGIQFPENRFRLSHIHSLASRSYQDYLAAGDEYLIASAAAFQPAMAAPQKHPDLARSYTELFRRAEPVAIILPTTEYLGSEYRVLAVRRLP
jgi:4-amino-4-deoxy-L-arabinose transferase-like glycosyltransferase